MDCNEVQDMMLAAMAHEGQRTAVKLAPEASTHMGSCGPCAGKWQSLSATSALMDEWRAPEVSPFFDTRFQAKLREVKAQEEQSSGALFGLRGWFRGPHLLRPLMGAALALAVVGGGVYEMRQQAAGTNPATVTHFKRGTAVDDLQKLDRKQGLYNEVDVLDDMTASAQPSTDSSSHASSNSDEL